MKKIPHPIQDQGSKRNLASAIVRYVPPSVDHDDFLTALAVLNARAIAYIASYDGRSGERRFGEPLAR